MKQRVVGGLIECGKLPFCYVCWYLSYLCAHSWNRIVGGGNCHLLDCAHVTYRRYVLFTVCFLW